MTLPKEDRPITLTDPIKPGLPPVAVPSFSISHTFPPENVDVNSTAAPLNGTTEVLNFGEVLGKIGSGLAVVPLIGFLESIAIAKSFGEFYDHIFIGRWSESYGFFLTRNLQNNIHLFL